MSEHQAGEHTGERKPYQEVGTLHALPDVEELKHRSHLEGDEPHTGSQFVPQGTKTERAENPPLPTPTQTQQRQLSAYEKLVRAHVAQLELEAYKKGERADVARLESEVRAEVAQLELEVPARLLRQSSEFLRAHLRAHLLPQRSEDDERRRRADYARPESEQLQRRIHIARLESEQLQRPIDIARLESEACKKGERADVAPLESEQLQRRIHIARLESEQLQRRIHIAQLESEAYKKGERADVAPLESEADEKRVPVEKARLQSEAYKKSERADVAPLESGELQRRIRIGRLESEQLQRRIHIAQLESEQLQRRIDIARLESEELQRFIHIARLESEADEKRVPVEKARLQSEAYKKSERADVAPLESGELQRRIRFGRLESEQLQRRIHIARLESEAYKKGERADVAPLESEELQRRIRIGRLESELQRVKTTLQELEELQRRIHIARLESEADEKRVPVEKARLQSEAYKKSERADVAPLESGELQRRIRIGRLESEEVERHRRAYYARLELELNEKSVGDMITKKPPNNTKVPVEIEQEIYEISDQLPTHSKAEVYKDEIDNTDPIADVSDSEYSFSVTEDSGLTSDNSITISEEGGCFRVPVASAFLLFPPKAVEKEVILTCSRVKHKECEVKPRDGELFVSRILSVEPEGVTFKKPVTVLLSHSVYEDQVFVDFYELIVENLSQNRWQELKTERISSIEDIPKEILNPEILGDYLPIAKATIRETCTLVAATRVKYDQISIPTNSSYVFSKQYGENAELNITFPAGVTEEILGLKVQLFPADAVLNKEVYSDKNLVCAPVIKVSGQTTPFLKAVDVELTYSNNDVANIEEDFLPVGDSIKFSTEYGLLLRSQKETESKSKCQTLNESNDVYIERLRKDQLKFSFSLKQFCKICSIAKKTGSAQLPNVEENSVVNQSLSQNRTFIAIVLAVHYLETKTIYAVLAPNTAQDDLKNNWKVAGLRLGLRLKSGERIYICVPLDKNTAHLPLEDFVLWFDHEMEFVLPNETSEDVHLEGKYMYFLLTECTGKNHNIGKDGCGKIGIHNFEEKPDKENIKSVNESLPCTARRQENCVLSIQGVAHNGHVTSQNEVMGKSLSRCEDFEKAIENIFLKNLGINKDEIQNPCVGSIAKVIDDAGTVSSIILGLGVGATVALSIGNFGIGAIVGATVAGVTFTVAKVDRKMKKSTAKKLDKKVEIYFHSHLKCIIMDVAKELSRMFEYQVLTLEDGKQIDILAECAVNLMLDLKKDDKFDRNTLIKKVLQDGKVEKRDLLTRIGDKWSAPDVFRKPGLQRAIVGTDRAEFSHQVKPNGACDTRTYGYRGQFLEMKECRGQNEEDEKVREIRYRKEPAKDETHAREDPCKDLCKECFSNFENCCSGQYFGESDIDSQYTESRDELSTYHPIHILIQCPKVLDSFIGSQLQGEKPSLANFLKKKLDLPEHHLVKPVYRQHSPGKVPDLQNSDLTGSDFSHSNFTNSVLTECHFVKCVMLFAKLAGAKMSGSKFCDTLISHSNLVKVEADRCEWTKTALLYSNVDGANLNSVEPSICGNCLDGTNICDANTGKMRELNCNETSDEKNN